MLKLGMFNKTVLDRVENQADEVAYAGAFHDLRPVRRNGFFGQVELVGDFLGRHAIGDHRQDLQLARRQHCFCVVLDGDGPYEVRDDLGGDGRAQI